MTNQIDELYFIMRSCQLFFIYLASGFRRLKYDLARESIILISAGLLGATFYYIFNDFVNEQMGKLRPDLKEQVVSVLTWVTLVTVSLWQAEKINTMIKAPNSFNRLLVRVGETPRTRVFFLISSVSFFLITTSLLNWLLIQSTLKPRSPAELVLTQSVFLFCILIYTLLKPSSDSEKKFSTPIRVAEKSTPENTLFSWRLQQVIFRNRAAQSSLIMALVCGSLAVFFTSIDTPAAALFVMLYLTGFFAALPVFFQLASDLKAAWAERSMGVSHEMIVELYRRIGYALVALPIIGVIAMGLVQGMSFLFVLQLGGVILTSVYLAPVLMFQIDANRPAIQALTLFFVGLFIATAVFVHIIGLILLPGFAYYALASQNGHYYRA